MRGCNSLVIGPAKDTRSCLLHLLRLLFEGQRHDRERVEAHATSQLLQWLRSGVLRLRILYRKFGVINRIAYVNHYVQLLLEEGRISTLKRNSTPERSVTKQFMILDLNETRESLHFNRGIRIDIRDAPSGIGKFTNPRFRENEVKSCVPLPAAGRRTQLFILLFSEAGVCEFAYPCISSILPERRFD